MASDLRITTMPGDFNADLAWAVAQKAVEHLGGTLDDLFRYGWDDSFPSEAWESTWLIFGPPLSKELLGIAEWFRECKKLEGA